MEKEPGSFLKMNHYYEAMIKLPNQITFAALLLLGVTIRLYFIFPLIVIFWLYLKLSSIRKKISSNKSVTFLALSAQSL